MKEHNPELVKQLLGEQVAELFDGTIEIEPIKDFENYSGLVAGDKLTFKFKNPNKVTRYFVVTKVK